MESFLQSKEWVGFQEALGRKVWQMNGVNVIKYNLPMGKSYLYSPRCRGDFLKKIREIAKEENSIFFKIEPLRQAQGKPFRKSTDIQPRKTLILDITKPEEELLKQMHHKTRYNIRLAKRKGVKIRIMNYESGIINRFWDLIQQTTKRDGFKPHPKEYYEKMLKVPGIELFVAEYQNKIIAANIVVFYKKIAIYLHGASDYKHRNLMAPHLLQWQQILEAKKQGCIEYDFWGINEKKWPGVTRFKKGFNGREVTYPGAFDLVFQPMWYKIYKLAKKFL